MEIHFNPDRVTQKLTISSSSFNSLKEVNFFSKEDSCTVLNLVDVQLFK